MKVVKGVFSAILLIFIGYVIYRNINLRVVPSVNLVKDEATQAMYSRILPVTSNGSWKNYYYSHDSVSLSELPQDMLYNIAYKNIGVSDSVIKESVLKEAYEKIFGVGTYSSTNSFYGGCNTYTYDAVNKTYNRTNTQKCLDDVVTILSRIVDAKDNGNLMSIDVVIAYINRGEGKVYKRCDASMDSCSDVLSSSITNFDEADLDLDKYDLQRYQFTFKNKNDEYYFDSVKRIK